MMGTHIHQQQVAQGGSLRASKTWRNTGGAGYRDIYVAYGTGLTMEAFLMEFGAIAVDQYCAAGVAVTTPVDCQVPEGATPGLKNALVGVGKYTDTVMTFDDYEIVPDAIEITVPTVPDLRIMAYGFAPETLPSVWNGPIDSYIADKDFWLGHQGGEITSALVGEYVDLWILVGNYGGAAGSKTIRVNIRGGIFPLYFNPIPQYAQWKKQKFTLHEPGPVEIIIDFGTPNEIHTSFLFTAEIPM